MTVDEKRVEVMINGQGYSISGDSGDENEAYLYRLGHYVDRKVQDVRKAYRRLNDADAAVMAAITIADELLKLRDENATMSARLTNALKAEGVDLNILEGADKAAAGKDEKVIQEGFLPKTQSEVKRPTPSTNRAAQNRSNK